MKPYYDRDGIVIYRGEAAELLTSLDPKSIDLVLTDPPYAEETHMGARSHTAIDDQMVDFASVTTGELRSYFDDIGRVARGWVVSFMDWRHIADFERQPPADLRFIRFGIWVKPNGAPQETQGAFL